MAIADASKTRAELAELVEKCNRCGFCQAGCPTYKATGLEWQVSRGRVALVRDILDGRIDLLEEDVREAIGTCLRCGACTVHCPPQVQTAEVIEKALEEIARLKGQPWIRRVLFHNVLPNPGTLDAAEKLVWFGQVTGLHGLVKSLGITKALGNDTHRAQDRLPRLAPRTARDLLPSVLRPVVNRKYRVAYFVGCSTNLVYPEVATATARVLQANQAEVLVPEVNCCGKLATAYGDTETARALARSNIDALYGLDVDAIVTDCATCGSFLKEYPKLLAEDDRYAEKAKVVAGKMRDFGEFVASIEVNPRMGEVKAKVTYHDPCHAIRYQGVAAQPRKLLKGIPGVDFKEASEADMCCGGAGSFFVTHYDLSEKVLDRKMGNVERTGAEYLATGCPGCVMQLSSGVRKHELPIKVVHTAQLLDKAYQTAK